MAIENDKRAKSKRRNIVYSYGIFIFNIYYIILL